MSANVNYSATNGSMQGDYNPIEMASHETVSTDVLDEDGANSKIEEETAYNMNVVSRFIDHCEQNGIHIPEWLFLSFFSG